MRPLLLTLVSCVLITYQVEQPNSKAVAFVAASKQTASPEEPAGQNLIQASEVSLETPTGTLFGTLLLPADKPPFPAVLLVAGSGMTDRDGNTVGLRGKSDCLKLLAEGLAQSGIASLRYDKRGVARSESARAAHNTFDIQADDAARWAAWLGQPSRFRAVGIVGHSEGAFVGTMAAQHGGVRAFVSLAGAGHRFDEVLNEQMGRAVRAGATPAKSRHCNECGAGGVACRARGQDAPTKHSR